MSFVKSTLPLAKNRIGMLHVTCYLILLAFLDLISVYVLLKKMFGANHVFFIVKGSKN